MSKDLEEFMKANLDNIKRYASMSYQDVVRQSILTIEIETPHWQKEMDALNSMIDFVAWFKAYWMGKKLDETWKNIMTEQLMYFEKIAVERNWIGFEVIEGAK